MQLEKNICFFLKKHVFSQKKTWPPKKKMLKKCFFSQKRCFNLCIDIYAIFQKKKKVKKKKLKKKTLGFFQKKNRKKNFFFFFFASLTLSLAASFLEALTSLSPSFSLLSVGSLAAPAGANML